MKKLKQTQPIHNTLTGYDFTIDAPLPRAKAMRLHCLFCAGDAAEVRRCEITDCLLWPYRQGRIQRLKPTEIRGLQTGTDPETDKTL